MYVTQVCMCFMEFYAYVMGVYACVWGFVCVLWGYSGDGGQERQKEKLE